MNIVDAYKDPRFDQSVDEGTDFRHKTVLCMPIKNSDALIIGVIQVSSFGSATNDSDDDAL